MSVLWMYFPLISLTISLIALAVATWTYREGERRYREEKAAHEQQQDRLVVRQGPPITTIWGRQFTDKELADAVYQGIRRKQERDA